MPSPEPAGWAGRSLGSGPARERAASGAGRPTPRPAEAVRQRSRVGRRRPRHRARRDGRAAGKSTAIGVLRGLVEPDSRTVSVLGRAPRQALAEGQVGVMLQDAGLMPGVSVGELLTFVRSLYDHPLALPDLVEAAGLNRLLRRRTDRLSGGEA
ncbi:MAG: ATP-binding cassette domain-containing protein, partial [Candidatus Dormibacteraceae bacterium]